jgi:hypothetical protein
MALTLYLPPELDHNDRSLRERIEELERRMDRFEWKGTPVRTPQLDGALDSLGRAVAREAAQHRTR